MADFMEMEITFKVLDLQMYIFKKNCVQRGLTIEPEIYDKNK